MHQKIEVGCPEFVDPHILVYKRSIRTARFRNRQNRGKIDGVHCPHTGTMCCQRHMVSSLVCKHVMRESKGVSRSII